jgi:hypothetical protein
MPVRLRSEQPDPSMGTGPARALSKGERSRVMHRAWHALAAYTAITLAATWPLARGLGRDVAWDLGDSLLNMWVLAWDSEQLLGILRGEFFRIATFFNGNIFHPEPLTLAYAEHLFPQAVQVLPIYAVTRNPILCYNLLFLATFVLSGFGTYLFVRELTGRPLAAFVAGLLFAFAPYRLPQSSHLQVLSSQWMPFALYAFRRYFASVEEGRRSMWPLAGATVALIAQNLSCGYYLLYFPPFAAAYVLWEIVDRGLLRTRRVWVQLSAAAVVVLLATVPFLLPYATLHDRLQFERARGEVVRYSADVYSYATAAADQPLWGKAMRAFPKPEGDLFPGVVPVLLALVGVLAWRVRRDGDGTPMPAPWRFRWLPPVLAAGAALHAILTIAGLVYRRISLDLGLFDLRITNINQMLLRSAICAALLLIVSPASRIRAGVFMRERGFFLGALIAALWLSLGPSPEVLGRPVELAAPYQFLYEHVPGFDGVRVPARFAMVAALMLAVLAGFGAAAIERWRASRPLLAVLSVAFLAESLVMPFTVNGLSPVRGYNTPELRVYRPDRAPEIYKEFARQAPVDAVLAEIPLGEPDFDLRAMFYSIVHWRPLLNGYSGFYPPHYGKLALALSDVPRFPEPAVEALRTYGATHVLVHEGAYLDARGVNTSAALRERGAIELYRGGSDLLLKLP